MNYCFPLSCRQHDARLGFGVRIFPVDDLLMTFPFFFFPFCLYDPILDGLISHSLFRFHFLWARLVYIAGWVFEVCISNGLVFAYSAAWHVTMIPWTWEGLLSSIFNNERPIMHSTIRYQSIDYSDGCYDSSTEAWWPCWWIHHPEAHFILVVVNFRVFPGVN